MDWGEPFVKACYFLEGDGPLAFECYKAIERVSASLHLHNAPNVHAIAQCLSGVQLSDTRTQKLVAYRCVKSCVQPGLDYFALQLGSSLKALFVAFRCATLFSPQKIYTMQPDATKVEQSLPAIPFLSSPSTVASPKAELQEYIARATDTSADFPALDWWRLNGGG